ncbi:target of Nesh-SH3 isoform X7 [Salmo trutta]|uniref:target of Nesh-SH3 isoform X7 n=1 Tax=Salmo trutta TaxID=8032 RepID=UPI001131FF74|nr:target of Nesh-SH3-like isoform X7 [Salmo trutta]
MQLSHTFLVFLFLLFIVEIALAGSSTARRSRVRRQNMKVRINATGDTIVMKFVRPNADTKLEGYILGYGSSMFSKQFIQLPENGLPYETEIDAEPKYLIAVQPIPVNDVKKQCTGNVNLEKPLHLVIGSVTPTSVLLSWGTFLKTPYEGDIMNDCLEDGNYTVRYRERNRKWTYQTCPASDTVIDSLKPNTAYEFGVRPNNKERSGVWSKPVIHNTNMSGKVMQKPYKPRTPLKPVKTVNMPRAFFPPRHDKLMDLKQGDNASILKSFPPVTAKPTKQKTTTLAPALNATGDNSSVFSSLPASEVDAMGKKRFVAPHVIYKTDKKPDEPCSITKSLSFFPEEEGVEQNVTAPPRLPPSNLTVVTVEGCPSFVILDWEKTDNDTTEYEVISRTHGPNGEEVSILTTNQTHTAVENLKPENSYEFKVKPKNELGEGPASEPVLFNTESADPRVSENVSGKDAIWTQFPFKADSYSECNGKQYVKRTWYRKFVGIQLCNSLRYKIYMSDSLTGKFYNIGDQTGHGEDHCQFVDSFLDGQTGSQLLADQLPSRSGFYRAMRQEPVNFGEIGGNSHATYVGWYECGTPIPGKW